MNRIEISKGWLRLTTDNMSLGTRDRAFPINIELDQDHIIDFWVKHGGDVNKIYDMTSDVLLALYRSVYDRYRDSLLAMYRDYEYDRSVRCVCDMSQHKKKNGDSMHYVCFNCFKQETVSGTGRN